MRSSLIALAAGLVPALTACASVASDPARMEPPRADETLGFPPARGPLVFPEGASEVSVAWVVDELARLTGVELLYDEQQRVEFEQERERLDQTEPVPADEVYPFVEALLISRAIYLERVKTGTPAMLQLRNASPRRGNFGNPQVVLVQDADLEALERHPALLVQYAMVLTHIDSRQLQTQLRQLLVDPSGNQQAVPAGDRGLLLQGPAYVLMPLIRLVREADRLSEPRPKAAEPGGPPSR
jgi:hypothetical protein